MQTTPILVTGGTGVLGRLVVLRLKNSGRVVRVLSRRPHRSDGGIEWMTGDLDTGQGIDAALNGVEVVIHCAGAPKGDEVRARTLVEAASRGGAPHIVYISVVGADRVPIDGRMDRAMFGYFGAKHEAERIIAGSGLPWTTLRATQFHDLLFDMTRTITKSPVVPVVAGFQFQPIDADEVAARLVELALGAPTGLAPDMGGPRVYDMKALIRAYLRASGKRRLIMPLPMPGKAARAFKAGANLARDRAVGRRTWEEFLAARLGRSQESRARTARPHPAR